MPPRKVSHYFKRLFHREPGSEVSQERCCHSCAAALNQETMGARILERCPKCRGIWLSRAQLLEILNQVSHKVEGDLATVEQDGHAEIGNTFAPSRVLRACPECKREMDNFKFESTGVWIDGCPDSHGIWLDNGELRLLAARTNTPSVQDPGTVLDAVSDLILGSL